ncbi:hypothetical protein EON63_19070, partial [archaeon]
MYMCIRLCQCGCTYGYVWVWICVRVWPNELYVYFESVYVHAYTVLVWLTCIYSMESDILCLHDAWRGVLYGVWYGCLPSPLYSLSNRVQLSSDGQRPPVSPKERYVQMHVSFISKQLHVIITERVLRDLFCAFGPVADVAVKKHTVHQASMSMGMGMDMDM